MLKKLALLLPFAFAITPTVSAQSQLAGDWQGTLEANGMTFHIVWHVVANPDGTLASTFDNVDEGVYGIKNKTTTVNGSDVAAAVDDTIQINGQDVNIKGTFVGKVNADATEVTGTWTQTDPEQAPAPLTLKHTPAQGAATSAAQPQLTGDWQGALSAGGMQLRLVLHISTAKDGTLSATLDSIDQGANGIPVNSVTLKDSKLNLAVDAVHGTYDGTINKDVSAIEGTWSQGQPLELNFKRAQPQTESKPVTPSDIDGTWTGSLDANGKALRINIKIMNMQDGLSATLQSPDQGPMWIPATSVTRSGVAFSMVINGIGGKYEGKIAPGLDSIDGIFSQGGGSMPLVVKRAKD